MEGDLDESSTPPPPPTSRIKLLWKDLPKRPLQYRITSQTNLSKLLDDDELLSNMKKCQTERYVRVLLRMPFGNPGLVSFGQGSSRLGGL